MMNSDRPALVQRGIRLSYLTIGYNAFEAIVALAAGLISGSVALVSFGVDSAIEVTSAGAAQFRLRSDLEPSRREKAEDQTRRIIGVSLLLLAAYVIVQSVRSLLLRQRPDTNFVGLLLLASSVVAMPLLARAKRKVAIGLVSGALAADAMQTSLCAYLSAIALIGVGLNSAFGWWWADPCAALSMAPIIVKEALYGLRGRPNCVNAC